MNDFAFYFALGWKHIVSLDAADHLLFILALSVIFSIHEWQKLLILITAFTIGHSLTLALSVYDLIRIKSNLVEFLIPVTIICTAAFNIFHKTSDKKISLNYFLALGFGLIHGMGFANNIRFMLAQDQHIAIPLFGFNVGLEAGQILVVAGILLISYLIMQMKVPAKWWINSVSMIVLIIAFWMAFERWPLLNNNR